MSWTMTNLISSVLLPPFSLLILLALGCLLLARRSRLAAPVLIFAFIISWVACSSYFADQGLRLLENKTQLADLSQPADAIVVLGGGSNFQAPEYSGQDTVGYFTLVRLRYGAHLHRETGKPILVTGGTPVGNSKSEAEQMQSVLEQEFNVPVTWTEPLAANTFENARFSADLLQAAKVKNIYLVTHAWHMPRAAEIFRQSGIEVIEAPTAFTTRHTLSLLDFVPTAKGLRHSAYFMHEVIGSFWYRIRLVFFD